MTQIVSWQLAGLASDTVGGPLDAYPWWKPDRVLGDGSFIRYWLDPEQRAAQPWVGATEDWPERVYARPGMLDAFLQLTDADADAVADFMRQFGVLAICDHGVPLTHAGDRLPGEPMPCGLLSEFGDGWFYEPLDHWRYYARQARALLDATAALDAGVSPSSASLEALGGTDTPGLEDYQWRYLISSKINRWLSWGNVRPAFRLVPTGPEIGLAVSSLFGALTAQLMSALSKKHGLALCSSCKQAYSPKRTPRRGERRYCPACRTWARGQDASRDLRERKRLNPGAYASPRKRGRKRKGETPAPKPLDPGLAQHEARPDSV